MLSNGGTLTNNWKIIGGDGGEGNTGAAGGNAVEMWGGTLTNSAGATITGGNGGQAFDFSGGNGGDGVLIRSGMSATVTNNGTITGGNTGFTNTSVVPGGYGVDIEADNATLINSGTISGGSDSNNNGLHGTTQADAVHIAGNNDRLELWERRHLHRKRGGGVRKNCDVCSRWRWHN